jgi:predicted oxidoreductase (fatty acid repression mutant protein)
MKRGRRSLREQVKSQILDILSNTRTPLTVSSIRMLILKKFDKKLSWSTVEKYLDELVRSKQVSAISLPHSKTKDKCGLTVYILKK